MFKRLNLVQKCILILVVLILVFFFLTTNRVTVTHVNVRLQLSPKPATPVPALPPPVPVLPPRPRPIIGQAFSKKFVVGAPRYYPRKSFPNAETFHLKEDALVHETTSIPMSPYREVKNNETCTVFLGIIKPGVEADEIPGPRFDPDTCIGKQYVEFPDKGDIVKYSQYATANMTCCLKIKEVVPNKKDPKKPKTVEKCPILSRISGGISTQLEFVEVNCSDPIRNISKKWEQHSRFVQKPGGQTKKKLWAEALKNGSLTEPPSVLLLGLRSLSSRQAKQLLPTTNDLLLKQMDFIPYDLYLKSGENVPETLFRMLTGMDWNQYMRMAAATNSTSVPAQKIILNDFNRIKYVTYAVVQEFFHSHGGILAFTTDHTTNSLLEAYHTGVLTRKKPEQGCFQYNLLNEILTFTSKFLMEYKSVPSFTTVWLDLFHQTFPNEALPSADKVLHSFFTKNKANLKNTIVILVSDQGSHTNSDLEDHGYFANNFPMLYIHYPERFKSNPGVKFNQNFPISAIDIHNTLQRTLLDACTEILKSKKPFPFESTRVCKNLRVPSSAVALWDRVKSNRDCKTLGVPDVVCQSACQVDPKAMTIEPLSNSDLEDIGHYLINFINQFIQDYFAKKVMINCCFWVLDIDAVRFSQVLRAGSVYKNGTRLTRHDVLVVIRVQPDRPNRSTGQLITEFETLVRVDKSEETKEMTVIGFPKRILQRNEILHKYTKCVQGDKNITIAEVCYCKQAPKFKFKRIQGRPDY